MKPSWEPNCFLFFLGENLSLIFIFILRMFDIFFKSLGLNLSVSTVETIFIGCLDAKVSIPISLNEGNVPIWHVVKITTYNF
jgi:hypothetical protein